MMKKIIKIIMIGSLVMFMLGLINCAKKNVKPEFSFISRDAYADKLKVQIDGWNDELKILENKVEYLTGDSKAKGLKHLKLLKIQKDSLKDILGKIKNAQDDAWVEYERSADAAKIKFAFDLGLAKLEIK